jgi:ABC-2 type transport system permease protein
MRIEIIKILAHQTWTNLLKSKATVGLMVLMGGLTLFALFTGYKNYKTQSETIATYRKNVRDNWENSPDKHPHRMAHYGYIAFREKHPLSIFDFGMESYTGNAVFLEAHRQNTVNFSEASLSTGILRFGEISVAMILQTLLPLLIFFWGFNSIAADRENGTLKLLLSQGISWMELILGRAMGLFAVASVVLGVALMGSLVALFLENTPLSPESIGMSYLHIFVILSLFYAVYIFIICLLAVVVSAKSPNAKSALTQLIGFWLFFSIILPRLSQAVGQSWHPAPSKVAFETAVEAELLQKGDSHNPNDPYFKAFKDSVLTANKVRSVEELSFNYSGLQMKEGERMSAEIYIRHQQNLMKIYEKQLNTGRYLAFFNPFIAIKNLSMSLTGTDFANYTHFQDAAEAYRFRLAQQMNDWQIQYVSNKKLGEKDKPYFISQAFWKQFPDFKYSFLSLGQSLKNEILAIMALILWFSGLLVMIKIMSKKLKAI